MFNSSRIIHPLLDKTLQIVKKNHIKKLSEDCYIVKATHDPVASYYLVRKENGVWKCSCRGFQLRGRCSHSLAVFLLEEKRRTLKIIEKIIRKLKGEDKPLVYGRDFTIEPLRIGSKKRGKEK